MFDAKKDVAKSIHYATPFRFIFYTKICVAKIPFCI